MKSFGYLRDPLFLVCCGLYALNRWALKPVLDIPFLRYWFNDVLLIPCALPVALWIQRWAGLRRQNTMPSLGEMSAHLLLWSLLFEVAGPHLFRRATGDPLDVVAYAAGTLLAFAWWHRGSLSNQLAE